MTHPRGTELKRLNLGSGPDKREDYLNIDIDSRNNPDILHDLNHVPWPIPSGSFDEVLASHVLEHLVNPLSAAFEAWRVLKPGGLFIVKVPHENCADSTRDWSHIHTRWNRARMNWLANPTSYANGLRFELVDYHAQRPLMRSFPTKRRFDFVNFFKWGELTATYRKVP